MNYAKIVPCDIANGEGVRVTLFVQGCDHHCPGCQNPTTWDPNGGQPFTDETLDKIVDLLRPDYIQGLTLTGGDPLYPENREMICKILIRVRHEFEGSKDIWMWTGYTWEELIQQAAEELKYQTIPTTVTIIRNINVLVDGPYIEAQRDISLPWAGSNNQRVIDVKKSIDKNEIVLWKEN